MAGPTFYAKYKRHMLAKVCRDRITDYWLTIMKTVSQQVYYVKKGSTIEGFVTLSNFTRKSLVVELICSHKKRGSALMNHVLSLYGHTHRITLSALDGLEQWYEQFAFRRIKKSTGNAMVRTPR